MKNINLCEMFEKLNGINLDLTFVNEILRHNVSKLPDNIFVFEYINKILVKQLNVIALLEQEVEKISISLEVGE